MIRLAALSLLCLALAAPALAGDAAAPKGGGKRLVLGGVTLGQTDLAPPDVRTELFSANGVSMGALTGPSGGDAVSGGGRLSMGGYLSFDGQGYRLGSSLRGDGDAAQAGIFASTSTAPLGFDGTAQLQLNADFGSRSLGFSLNPAQNNGLDDWTGTLSGNDVSLSLSWSRDVTPSLSLGGTAATAHPLQPQSQPSGGFSLGAGLGYRF